MVKVNQRWIRKKLKGCFLYFCLFAAFVQGKNNQNTKFKENIKVRTFVKINKIKLWNEDKDYLAVMFFLFFFPLLNLEIQLKILFGILKEKNSEITEKRMKRTGRKNNIHFGYVVDAKMGKRKGV